MQFHSIQPLHRPRRARRVGRGGKRGTYSGRGMKGQKARGKNKIRPEIRDFIKRTPKLRGEEFPSLPRRPRPVIVQIGDVAARAHDGAVVTPKSLVALGLLPEHKRPVKLLGGGDVTRKLLVSGISVSKSAREKIEKAGGMIQDSKKKDDA